MKFQVPGSLDIKNRGSSISFNVPSSPNANNKTKGLKWTYWPTFTGISDQGKDMIWLNEWKIADQLMDGGDEVTISVNMEEQYQLKEFGIRIVYDEQEEKVTEQNAIDLSAYEMSAGRAGLSY
ncbi:unnamed protein product [Camellia sinensis]